MIQPSLETRPTSANRARKPDVNVDVVHSTAAHAAAATTAPTVRIRTTATETSLPAGNTPTLRRGCIVGPARYAMRQSRKDFSGTWRNDTARGSRPAGRSAHILRPCDAELGGTAGEIERSASSVC